MCTDLEPLLDTFLVVLFTFPRKVDNYIILFKKQGGTEIRKTAELSDLQVDIFNI